MKRKHNISTTPRLLTLILMVTMLVWSNCAWAATAEDLVPIRRNWTFIADNITDGGNTKLVAGTLYANNRIFAPTSNTVTTGKETSTFTDGRKHNNSLRLKTVQDKLVFKVSQACTITFYTESHNSRGIVISKQDRTAESDPYYLQQPSSTPKWVVELDEAGTYYLSNYGGDFYFAGFEITGITEPDRTFTDFKIDFRSDPYTVVSPTEGLPTGVELSAGSFHDAQHGYQNGKLTVPVDGLVKFTIGACYHTNKATVSIDGGAAIDIETKSAACDNSGVGSTYNKYVEYYYKFDKAATLTFNLGSYCPYIEAKAITENDLPSTSKITFSKGSTGCIGVLPLDADVEYGGEYELPGNSTLYKEGYTLTGWESNSQTYEIGETVSGIKADMEFTPVFTQNTKTLNDRTDALEINWDMSKTKGLNMSGSGNVYVTQVTVADEKIDVALDVTGTFKTNNDWIAVNNGTSIGIPSCQGASIEFRSYSNPTSSAKINGETLIENDATNHIVRYTERTATTTSTLAFTGNPYLKYIKLTLPTTDAEAQYTSDATYNAIVSNVKQLKKALFDANGTEGHPFKIYVNNGTYDLGSAHNTLVPDYTEIVGESRDGVIIKNTLEQECINATATLQTGSHVKLTSLTLKCRATYGTSDDNRDSERGVCLQDAGTDNLYTDICLDGLQDTYYSCGPKGMTSTFDNCVIRGNTDFICGSGNIIFNGCTLEIASTHTGGGKPIIVAPSTYTDEKEGYVFYNCTVDAAAAVDDCTGHISGTVANDGYYLGRGWYGGSGTDRTPRASFFNTTFNITPDPALWTDRIGVAVAEDRSVFVNDTEGTYEPEIEDVTESTTWDWTKTGKTEVKFDNTTPIRKDAIFAFNNRYALGEPANFNAASLLGRGEYAVRDGKYFQGQMLKFHTTVAGKIKVSFSNTGSSNPCRYLYVNDVNTNVGSTASTEKDKITDYIDVPAGYVILTAKEDGGDALKYLRIYSVEFKSGEEEEAPKYPERTAVWDWQNGIPASITSTNIQNNTGTVDSNIDGVQLAVDATANNAKLGYRTQKDAQFNAGTIISVPVRFKGDIVTVVSYPGYHNYTVGGTAASADETRYVATAADAAAGKVDVVGTGSSYLYSITVQQLANRGLEERCLYSTDFQNWESAAAQNTDNQINKTAADNQALTFSLLETQVAPTGTQSKFTNACVTPGYLVCEKVTNTQTITPYIKTSTLNNVTKVTFVHAATASNRGWGLKVKGDKDADWVTLSSATAAQEGTEVEVEVNRKNVQLWFYNLAPAQNAYMTSLKIYGELDPSTDTESPRVLDDVPSAAISAMPEIEVQISLFGGHYQTIQWYKNSTNAASGGTAIQGATEATLKYTPTTEDAGKTLYFYAVLTNPAATGTQTTTSGVATVNVGRRAACNLLEMKLSNGFNTFIVESEKGNTVKGYYMQGAEVPTISSHNESDGASFAIDGGTITITAEDGTTTKTYTYTCEAIEPLTSKELQTLAKDAPSWLKGGAWHDSEPFTYETWKHTASYIKNGYNRIYLFVGPCEVVNLVATTNARHDANGNRGKITTYIGGTSHEESVTLPEPGTVLTIPCTEDGNTLVEIVNESTSNEWGFNTVQLSSLATISFTAGSGTVGTVPATVIVPSTNGRVDIPVNTTLYKHGYTLTGWKDNRGNHYDLGKTYNFTEDANLQAEWRKNIEDFTDYPSGKTITWKLCTRDGGPSIDPQAAHCFVQQERIIEETNDIALNVAKIKNRGDSWITFFSDATIGTYLVNGSKITFDVYYAGSYTLKVDEERKQNYEIAANGDNNHCEFTYTGESGWVEFTISKSGSSNYFVKAFKTTYPAKTASDLTIADGKQKVTLDEEHLNYTLTKGTDYTTSSTGAMHYTSSDENIVTVSDAGVITKVAGGDAKVTVRQEGDNTYGIGTIVFDVHVKAPVTITFDGTTKTVYSGERIGTGVIPAYTGEVPSGKRFHGWFTSTDGNGDRASEVYVVKKATDFHAYIMDIPQTENGFVMVPTTGANDKLKGDALLNAIEYANEQAKSTSQRVKVFIPNGTYDLGTQVLSIVGSNVSLIGESMEGVIIQNEPSIEGLDNTATFKVTGDNVVMQNLTIKNRVEEALDGTQYPQGVCIEDAGAQNVYREVRLLGRQNTYYASSASVKSYFENSEIHGTVDIVGGDGDVWFEGCKLMIEPNNVSYIAAPATTTAGGKGFIFNGCTIASASTSMAGKYYLGHGFKATAKAAFHNTNKTIAYKETGWGKHIVSGGTYVETGSAPSASVSDVVPSYTNDNKPNAPTNVVLNKENYTLTWNKVENASSYIIYKDGNRIAMVAATGDATQSYVIQEANRAKGIKARSNTTAAAIEGGYSVATVSATGIIGDAKAEAQIPAITKDITATAVYVGKAQNFAIEALDATTYQWYKSNTRGSYLVVAVDGNKIASAENASFNYTATEEGTVYLVCKAHNRQGDTYSSVVAVTAQNPVITQDLNAKYGAVKDQEKVLNIVAEGGATYQWYTCADAAGTTPVAISGATSSMLTQTWTETGTHYIYCKVNGVVSSKITTVTVAETAAGGEKIQHVGQPITEVYDFATLVAGGTPNLTVSGDAIHQTGTHGRDVFKVDNPTGTSSGKTLELNGRFYVANDSKSSANQMRWMWRSSTTAYQNGMAGQWYGKGTTLPNNLTVVGLYAGDKITITYAPRAGKDANIRVCDADQLTGVGADATISSTVEYTVAKNGQLDLYVNDNNMAIQNVKIVTEWYATSEPSITKDIIDCHAYVNVPRVLTVAASNAESYQWYKNSTKSTEGATPIDGATTNTYVYTPESAGTEFIFCVARNENGSKASSIAAVPTTAPELHTIDFINRADNDKTLVFGAQNGTAKNSAGTALAVNNVEQPYDIKGYLAVYLDAAKGGFVNSNGLTNANGSGDRPFKIPGLQTGDVITFIGSGLFSGMGVHSSIHATVSAKDDIVSVEMTNNEDLNVWMVRQNAAHIEQIIIKKKTTPAFTQNLNEKYFVTTGGSQTLTIQTSAKGEGETYQWYRNTHASNMGGEAIPGAATASYTPATSANGTGYYYCVVTNTTTNTVAVSNVAQVDVANVVFRDFELDVRQKRDYGLTEAEAVEGHDVDFGVLVDEDGTLTRIEKDAYANANVKVAGTYEGTVLGLKDATFVVPVQGKVKFSIGKTGNTDSPKDYGDVTVKDAAGTVVATLSTKGGKWSSNKKNVVYGYYTGPSTTLTFTTSAYVPYIRVEAVQVAELNAPTIRQTSFDVVQGKWAVTMATNVDADGARIYYTTDGTDPTVGSTLYSGTAYIAPNTTIKALAVCDGWYDSDISSLKTATQPETKGTELISYTKGATGDNIGMTYTVAATYNGGQPTEGDGLKMNLTDVHNEGDNPYTVNGFRINVNNGYRITGIDVNGLTYDEIYIDGVKHTGELTALNATQTIDFVCEGSTPIDTKITLSYEFADDVTGITVNGEALTAEQVTAFKNKTLSIDTQYKGAPEVVVTTALGYTYPVAGVAGDGTTYTYGFNKVGDCSMTFTNVLKALPVITFIENKFYYANPDGEASRGKGYNFTVSGEAGGTYTITIDGGAEQAYDSEKKYYAIETATVKYNNADASYPKDLVTAHVASTDFAPEKPFAVYLYSGGYTDQNMEPKPLEAKMILDGIAETYNVVFVNKGELALTGDAGIKDLDNLGKADLIVLSEAMSSSEKLFMTFDYKNGTTPDASNVAKQLGLGTTNVLNFKIFATKSSVWNWATPSAIDTKNVSIIPNNPLYSVFNGVNFNDDANHTIDLWNANHAPLLNHLQGVNTYIEGSKGPEFVNLATAQSSATSTLDVLQYRYSTALADDATQVATDNKVFVNFGLNINDYSAYDENVKTIVGNICRMINDRTPLNSVATELTKPVITDNGDGSAKIMTSTSLATIKYVAYDAAPGEAPTAEHIKTNGMEAVKGITKQFATDKYIYAIAMMDGMTDSPVSEAGQVVGSPLRKITRRALPEDDVVGVEVTQTVSRNADLKVPYNQTYKKEGYTVTSWIDQNTGTIYYPGEALTLDQDLDLVAQWTKNTKTVADLCGGAEEQRTATFNFLMKDGAPEMKLDGANLSGILVGQVRFSNEKGDFIDVVAEISGRETLNPQSGKIDAGKVQNNFTNSSNWLSGDGSQMKEYCQVKTGTVFTFPAVYGMEVNFKATDLERDEEGSRQVQVHRSYIGNTILTDGMLTNPAFEVDAAGNYILSHDNYAEGGRYSYSGQTLKAELVVRESSMVYERTNTSEPKETIFEHEPGWNDNSIFMDRLSVTYPALYKVNPKLNPAKSEIAADEPTAYITFEPEVPKNTNGKFVAGSNVKMLVTPTYAYKFNGTAGTEDDVTIVTSGEGVPEDGAVYTFVMPTNDIEFTVNMLKLATRTIKSSTTPLDAGQVVYDPDYTSFVDGKKVTLTANPKMGYEFVAWTTDVEGTIPVSGEYYTVDGANRKLTVTVNSTTGSTTGTDQRIHYAQFKLGKMGTVHYDLQHAVLLKGDGTQESTSHNLTTDGEAHTSGFPTSMTNSAMVIPTYYTMYKEGYTLDHWVACDADGTNDVTPATRYDIGTYYYFDTENEVRYIKPVFKKNITNFDYRTTDVDIRWDFRRAYFAQQMSFGQNTQLRYSTHATINKPTDAMGQVTMDVPLIINTATKGKIDNTDIDEWTTIGDGTTMTIPSGYEAKFTLASYAPITTTMIDNDVLTNYTVVEESGVKVYLYTYTTKSTGTSVTLNIGNDFGYYKYLRAQLPAADKVGLDIAVNNTVMGSAKLESAGTVVNGDDIEFTDLGEGKYTLPLGSVVTITAKRNRLYEFDHWEDGNGDPVVADGEKIIITTDKDAATGETSSTLIFSLSKYQTNVKAVFRPREQYQVNYTAGSLASGIAPAIQLIEKGESFTLPSHNQVLYYEGHTLKYWLDESGNRYDFGESYKPSSNLLLSPVFLPNEFAFSDILNDVTMTWPLAVAEGATDINFRGSSGIIVDQMEYEGMKIDMKLDIKSSSTSYRAYNNTNDAYCLITDGVIIEMPSTPGCKITLNSYEEKVTATEIAGATSTVAGANTVDKYAAGVSPTVVIKQNNTQGAQTISFKGDSPSFTSISVTYTAITGVSLPELVEVTVGGVALESGKYSNYSIVDLNSDKVLNNIPVEYVDGMLPEVVVTKTSNSKESGGTWTTSDEITYVQATIDNPTATIILKSAHGIIAGVYKLNFKPAKITGSPTLEKVNIYRQDRTPVDSVYDAGTVAPNSVVTLTFDRVMAAKTVTIDDIIVDHSEQTGTFHGSIYSDEGKEMKFSYWDLDLGKTYKFTVKANTLKDVYGNYYDKPLKFKFTISNKLIQSPDHRVYDFVVTHRETYDHSKGKDKASQLDPGSRVLVASDALIANLEKEGKVYGTDFGTIDQAIERANASNISGNRSFFRIFVPDGEYQIGGNNPFNPGRDFSDNKDGKVIAKANFPYNNGETFITRPRTSIIGQSQDKTVIYSDPYFYGISYTSTIEVRPQVTDCYFQDLTLDNRYSWHQMESGAKPAGQCAAFYDRGQRTILKNVGVLGYQDSYVSDATPYAQGKTRGYYETCTFAGTVDFLCGDGDMWWERCKFLMRYRASNNFIAPRQTADTKWGYVFHDCVIDAEDEAKTHAYQKVWNTYEATYEINNGNYHLGRPWENSPYVTLLNTKMVVQPNPEGWMNMKDAGLVLRFQEYGTVDKAGNPVDLSTRTTRLSTPGPGSYDVVMTAKDTVRYNLHNVIGGGEGYDPKVYTRQCAPVENIGFNDTELEWNGIEDALCYCIFKSDKKDGEFKLFAITAKTKFDCGRDRNEAWYIVRAANQRGGLGEPTKPLLHEESQTYTLSIKKTETKDGVDYGWSTICLPFNAKVPKEDINGVPRDLNVYAGKLKDGHSTVDDYELLLEAVDIVNAEKGYVVYGPVGEYHFNSSSRTSPVETILEGNPQNVAISSANHNCYVLSNKPSTYGIGFYKFTGTTLAANRAWLPVSQVSSGTQTGVNQGKAIRLVLWNFGDISTGIDGISAMPWRPEDRVYDLSGNRIRTDSNTPPPAGIYIINGRKVVVK